MTDERSDSQLERAALHALGSLDGDEHLQFKRLIEDEGAAAQHARNDLASFEPIAVWLGEAVPPVTPPAALKAKILERIQRTAQEPALTQAGFTLIRSSEGTWVEPMPAYNLRCCMWSLSPREPRRSRSSRQAFAMSPIGMRKSKNCSSWKVVSSVKVRHSCPVTTIDRTPVPCMPKRARTKAAHC